MSIHAEKIAQLEEAIQSRKDVYGSRLDDDWDDAAFVASVEIKMAEDKIKQLTKEIR